MSQFFNCFFLLVLFKNIFVFLREKKIYILFLKVLLLLPFMFNVCDPFQINFSVSIHFAYSMQSRPRFIYFPSGAFHEEEYPFPAELQCHLSGKLGGCIYIWVYFCTVFFSILSCEQRISGRPEIVISQDAIFRLRHERLCKVLLSLCLTYFPSLYKDIHWQWWPQKFSYKLLCLLFLIKKI